MNRYVRLLAVLLVILTLSLSLSSLAVAENRAADNGITIISNSYNNQFPTQMTFSLEASSTADINKVTFYYKLKGSPVLTYAYTKFDPGQSIKTDYVWNTQKNYLPPGVELQYYWVIEDAAGNKLKTDPVAYTIEDTRFQWQQLTGDKVTIYWYQGDANFANTLMEDANKALVQLGRDVGITIQDQVKIFIYASNKDLLGALEPKAQEWTGGRSFSELGIIAIIVEPNDSGLAFAARAVPHELNHMVVHQAVANPYGDIPQWLSEGLAMHSEGPFEDSFKSALDRAVRSKRLISLQSLGANFPADPAAATLSYAESYSVVDYIFNQYGRDAMANLLATFKEGSTYDDALMAALGTDTDGLEAEWLTSLGLQPNSVPLPAGKSAQNVQPQSEEVRPAA